MADRTQAMPETGATHIGKYPVTRRLGKGAMGEVWLGHHPELDIPVAVKVLSALLTEQDPGFVTRFLKEARTAARINHPNVVRVYDAGSDGDKHFIVMEFVDGGTARDRLAAAKGPLPTAEALRLVEQVAAALEAAAEFQIVHRDIKPENIMLDSKGTAKLADLGLAKQLGANDGRSMTGTGMAMGTPNYMAPEQARDAKSCDARADIYSLGATLYHLVTGGLPFEAVSSFEMMLKHLREPLPPPKVKNPGLPDSVCAIITKMMAKEPAQRYQTAAALRADLRLVREQNVPVRKLLAGREAPDGSGQPRALPWPPKLSGPAGWRWLAVGGGVLALLLLAAAGLVAANRGRGGRPARGAPAGDQTVVKTGGAGATHVDPGTGGQAPVTTPTSTPTPTPTPGATPVAGTTPPPTTPPSPPATTEPPAEPPAGATAGDPVPTPTVAAVASPPVAPSVPVTPPVPPAVPPVAPAGPAPTTPQEGKPFRVPTLELELLPVPAGTFTMGSPESESDRRSNEALHKVVISRPFWLGKYEVTRAQYEEFVRLSGFLPALERDTAETGDKGQAAPTWRTAFAGDNLPVACLAWGDTVPFCLWLTQQEDRAGRLPAGYVYRLPTEAEWEYVCRAGTQTAYSFGDRADDAHAYAWTKANSESRPRPVGTRKPNAWGFYDMHGNVLEACLDGSDMDGNQLKALSDPPDAVDPVHLRGMSRLFRGGSFYVPPMLARSAARYGFTPRFTQLSNGFRVALAPELAGMREMPGPDGARPGETPRAGETPRTGGGSITTTVTPMERPPERPLERPFPPSGSGTRQPPERPPPPSGGGKLPGGKRPPK